MPRAIRRGAVVAVVLGGLVAFPLKDPAVVGQERPAPPTVTEIDLTGEWSVVSNEEDGGIGGGRNRGGGSPEGVVTETIGNYLGLPLNEAGRLKGISWDASIYSHPAVQVKSHPLQFYMRGAFGGFRFEKVRDDRTQAVVAYRMVGGWGANGDRIIWLDGRPSPPAYAEHTWHGFSSGRWDKGLLAVTTTHISEGYLRRNRAPASRHSVVTEYFIRRGDHMTHILWVDDPAYLEEPYVTTSDFALNIDGRPARRFPKYWDTAEEVPWPKGYAPHYPLGWQHTDVADILGIPVSAVEGGKETIYPEYRPKLKKLISELPPVAPGEAAPGSVTRGREQ